MELNLDIGHQNGFISNEVCIEYAKSQIDLYQYIQLEHIWFIVISTVLTLTFLIIYKRPITFENQAKLEAILVVLSMFFQFAFLIVNLLK